LVLYYYGINAEFGEMGEVVWDATCSTSVWFATLRPMPTGQNEAFSRVLIDRALEFSKWNLLDPHEVRFEINGATGRADYVLMAQRGGALCVLEAKREDVDPYDAKEQARGYAENLKAPFIILSNGKEHWFWNHTRKDQDA
jgi:type I site-specific restriction endonuclease